MSTNLVAIRLLGVLQSWGADSEYTYRNSSLFPTKSAVLGLCCAAKGLSRGSEGERVFLERIADCPMTAVAIPRVRTGSDTSWPINVRRITDFHTVERTKTATGKLNPHAVMTYRQYLCDADFLVLIEMDAAIADDLGAKLSDPDWGLWLGRKSCIPSAPIFGGVFSTMEEVSSNLLNEQPITCFTHQKEVTSFEKGSDTLRDKPLDFAIHKRVRGQRRVRIYEAEIAV
jgi:CRISPR system Cascade subunit CasD